MRPVCDALVTRQMSNRLNLTSLHRRATRFDACVPPVLGPPHTSVVSRRTVYSHSDLFICWLSQQQASVSQGRICSYNITCCHTEMKVADQTFYLTQSQYTDTGPTSPCTDPISPGAWQGSHWSEFLSHWYYSTPGKSRHKRDSNPDLPLSVAFADALTIRPTRRSPWWRRVAYQMQAHWKHMRGTTFLACGHLSIIWNITQAI